jgi:predicted nucleotide-binding protein
MKSHRTYHPDEKKFRARQNVVLELGMLLSSLGRSKVAILMKNPGKMERLSDIQGLLYISMVARGFDVSVAKI